MLVFELLDMHGYRNWPERLDGIKLMLFNSLPPLHTGSKLEMLTDLIDVLEGHISMAEGAKLFEGADDLMNALL